MFDLWSGVCVCFLAGGVCIVFVVWGLAFDYFIPAPTFVIKILFLNVSSHDMLDHLFIKFFPKT